MQRYRVNYRLLIGLVVGMMVAAPAAYGLWWFQVDRNATRLLEEADIAEKEGDVETAYEALSQYVKLRREEPEAQLRIGRAAVKISDLPDVSREVGSEAYFLLLDAVQRTDDPELRRELVDLHLKWGYLDRALDTINVLIDAGSKDPELMALKARCLFYSQDTGKATQWSYQCIGYDAKTQSFDAAQGLAPHEPEVYENLVRYLYGSQQKELGEKVLDQMVVANPESREAFVIRYRLLKAMNKDELAREALEKAFALEPHDADVLLNKGVEAIADYEKTLREASEAESTEQAEELRKTAEKHLDAASKFFAEGLEKHPDRIDFYTYSARIEMFRKHMDEALVIVDHGLKEFDLRTKVNMMGLPAALDLANLKIDILFAKKDVPGVRAMIKELRDLKNTLVLAVADFQEAKIELLNENWAEAARRLGAVKPRLNALANLQALAAVSKAQCHVQLGQYDLASDEYDWIIERFPNYAPAKLGKADVDRLRGQMDNDGTALQFDEMVAKMLELPREEQDWEQLESRIDDFVVKQAEMNGATQTWIDSRQELLRAQMYVTRASKETDKIEQARLFGLAREAIKRAYALDKEDPAVQLAAPRVLMLEPGSGPAKALKLLDDIVAANAAKGVKESLPFRQLRIDLLFALQDEDLPNQLHAATTGIEHMAPSQQAEIWKIVGNRFQQLGRASDATVCLQEAAKLSPFALPVRMEIFEVARAQGDDEGMQAAQQAILEIVKDKGEPDYVLTEVKRMMVNYANAKITKDDLKQARALIDEAIRRRPGWAELYVLSGQLAMVLEQNADLALRNFAQALENGPANLNALNLQVRLLADMGRYAEAREIMNRIPEASWTAILDRAAANVLRNVGENDRAYEEGKKLVAQRPTEAQLQVWFSEVARAAGKLEDAEAALQAAVKINPADPDLWSALLSYYMAAERVTAVELTLRRAELALDEEYLPMLTAHQHRLFGRFPEAETIFLSSYRDTLDQLPIAQRMAEFYLSWAEGDARARARMLGPTAVPEPGGTVTIRDKAIPLINRILRAANEGKAEQTDPAVAWARRQAARLLSLNGDYQDSLRAEQLLASAVAKHVATADAQEMLIDILNRRGDPASRERSIAVLQEIQKERGLRPEYELQLGQALAGVGRWEDCQRQMQNAIGKYPTDLALRVGLIEMLIDRKNADAAETWLRRLETIDGGSSAAPQLRIRLAAAMGQKAELRAMLEKLTPNLGQRLSPEQMTIVRSVALLAQSVGDSEYALKLITEYSRRVPGNEFELAYYTAMYGDLDAGIEMLKQQFPANMDQILSTAIEVMRTRRNENPEKLDAEITRMVGQARRDDPEAARRMVLEAESLEVQQKFDEAVAAYRKLLARDDVPRFVRATAQNNLAFLLAMMKQDLDQALAGVNEAIEIIGPISDVLDTRALVYIHRGEYQLAIEDLRTAVKDKGTASKYFHLATALLGAGDQNGALAAWKEAESRGISIDKVPQVERNDFEQTQKKIEALRGTNAQLRRAAPYPAAELVLTGPLRHPEVGRGVLRPVDLRLVALVDCEVTGPSLPNAPAAEPGQSWWSAGPLVKMHQVA